MRPRAGERHIEVVAILLGLEATFAGRPGRAIHRYPVAKLRGAALEVPLGFLGVVPDVFPYAFHQHAHDDLLDCFLDRNSNRLARCREPVAH